MKIYVNEVPTKPKDCLFARKEVETNLFNIENGERIPIYAYYCNVNMKRCNLDCGGRCNKLRVPITHM